MTTPDDTSAVTTQRTITVDTGDLRNALRAVAPHAKKVTTGEDAVEHRIRLHLDLPPKKDEDRPDFEDDTWLRIMATNGVTTAVALVQVLDDDGAKGVNHADGPFRFDVRPASGRIILQAFKTNEAAEQQTLQLRIRDVRDLRLTDASGLPGLPSPVAGVTINQMPFADTFPDLVEASARALSEATGLSPVGRPLVGSGPMLALFAAAERVYERSLRIEPIGTDAGEGFVITCGARFVGTIAGSPAALKDDTRLSLLRRFGVGELAGTSA